MKIVKFIFALIFLSFAIIIPFFYEDLVLYGIENIELGWVISSIFIRVLVIVFFLLFLKILFSLFQKTKNWKNWVILLIGFVPGFFISFAIAPIYDIDYGMLNDGMELPNPQELESSSSNAYKRSDQKEIIAFLDVGCHFCQVACQKLAINKRLNPSIEISLFFTGEEKDIIHFLKKNNAENLDYYILDKMETFIKFAGFSFPSIYYITEKGDTKFHWVGDKMNYSAMDFLLNEFDG